MIKIKSPHKWDVSYKEAVLLQKRLQEKLILKDRLPRKIKTVGGIDVSYSKATNELFAIIVVLSYPGFEVVKVAGFRDEARFPYIPGLLSFRETPAIIKAVKKLKFLPDILMFDGQGIAHPRGFGIASHAGVILGIPSIGCAKSRLFGKYREPGTKKGSYSLLKDTENKTIGCVLRTRDNVNPVFVSAGHMICNDTARKFTLKCTGAFRIPIPTRQAHIKSVEWGRRYSLTC